MPVLPASVRLALWATAAYAGRVELDEVVALAHPDVDHVAGDPAERLALWRDLGERAVLVALPRPGKLAGMPRGSAAFVAAATDAGECVYVPGVGGAMVPEIDHFGPSGDRGTRVTWTTYDADPVPPHTLDALSLNEIELRLRQELMERTHEIEALDAQPWAGSAFRQMADDRVGRGRWGLPDGLPRRATTVISMASAVGGAVEVGLTAAAQSQTLTSQVTEQRRLLLAALEATAEEALAAAATVSALALAGLRPGRPDA